MDCKFKTKSGCMMPIPTNCNDECAYGQLLEKYRELKANNEMLSGQYRALLNRYNSLLEEISLTN